MGDKNSIVKNFKMGFIAIILANIIAAIMFFVSYSILKELWLLIAALAMILATVGFALLAIKYYDKLVNKYGKE